MKTYVRYYDVRKDRNGRSSFVAHKRKIADENATKEADAGDKKDENSGQGAKPENEDDDAGGKGDTADKGWTAEEDVKLKALKTENKAWKEISNEMDRPVYELKNRFKKIKDCGNAGTEKAKEEEAKNDSAGNGIQQGGKGKGKKGKNGNGQPDWANMTPSEKKVECLKRKAEERRNRQKVNSDGDTGNKKDEQKDEGKEKNESKNDEKDKASKKDEHEKRHGDKSKGDSRTEKPKAASKISSIKKTSSRDEARFTMREWMTLQEDELFSFGELQCLSEIIMRDSNQTWLRVAASFFDKTGRRVHPEDIREKFEQMARMAGS